MAHPDIAHGESGRTETIDPTSGGPKSTSGMHLTSYAGLAIAALILIAVLIVQGMTAT